ncbi:hypothetical protein F5Y12DRAFT_749273 [Xylaria sp. FL1777]|nr:hypothetical protein F5Y12DRAFT_749273 [Xylaria sp. FL1777]
MNTFTCTDDSPSFSVENESANLLNLKRKLGDIVADCQNSANTTDLNPAAPTKLQLDLPDQKPSGSIVKKLACPFYKRDAHSPAISRACRGVGWASISRVKEHIYRCHAPKHQCNRCHKGFDSDVDLATHQRSSDPCPLLDTPLAETISGDQRAQLRHYGGKRVKGANEEKWRSLYRILFPGDSFIPSPYYDEPCGNCISKTSSRLLDDYRQHQLKELTPLIEQELAAISYSNNMSDDLCAHIADLLSRLSLKVLNEFQGKYSREKEPATCPSKHGDGVEGIVSETQTVPALNPLLFIHGSMMLDIAEDPLSNFDFTVGK